MPQSARPSYGSSTAANGIRYGGESKLYQEADPFVGHLSRKQTCLTFDVEEMKPESEQENSVAPHSTRTTKMVQTEYQFAV